MSEMAASSKYIIAVVDDDSRILESLENLLESAGHTVRVFPSAELFLKRNGFKGIDCLISDIGMPVIDGLELQQLAKVARPDLPVILITGRHENADRERAISQGSSAFFQKPFNGHDLLRAIKEALRMPPK
jgi:FixJ family two-component response regulator